MNYQNNFNYIDQRQSRNQKSQFVFCYNKRDQKYDFDEEIDDQGVSTVIDKINKSNTYIPYKQSKKCLGFFYILLVVVFVVILSYISLILMLLFLFNPIIVIALCLIVYKLTKNLGIILT